MCDPHSVVESDNNIDVALIVTPITSINIVTWLRCKLIANKLFFIALPKYGHFIFRRSYNTTFSFTVFLNSILFWFKFDGFLLKIIYLLFETILFFDVFLFIFLISILCIHSGIIHFNNRISMLVNKDEIEDDVAVQAEPFTDSNHLPANPYMWQSLNFIDHLRKTLAKNLNYVQNLLLKWKFEMVW